MSAISVIPHPPTGEQPHFSDELHNLLTQLDDTELVALATVIFTSVAPELRTQEDAVTMRLLTRCVARADRLRLVSELGQFALLLIARKACH